MYHFRCLWSALRYQREYFCVSGPAAILSDFLLQYNLEAKEIRIESEASTGFGPGQNSGAISAFFTMVLVACSYPAIDIITGERERKSLQVLLLGPVNRKNILLNLLVVSRSVGYLPSPSV
ncbi:MAG: ABC transporter permease subunit [Cyanobacteriota/Melainabacteria group bacterium]